MNNELTLWSQASIQTELWNTKIAETHSYLDLEDEYEQRQFELTQSQIELTIERTKNALKIGENLEFFKEHLPHGEYMNFVKAEFGLKTRTSQNYKNLYLNRDKLARLANLSLESSYELTTHNTPPVVIEMVESGEVAPTLEAIRDAKKAAKEAEKAKNNLQKEFDLFKAQTEQEREKQSEELQRKLDSKNKEIELYKWQKDLQDSQQQTLEADIKRLKEEKVQIIKEDTPETKDKLEQTEQRLKDLEEQQKTLQSEQDKKSEELEKSTKHAQELGAQLQSYLAKDAQDKRNAYTRLTWEQIYDIVRVGTNQAFGRWVSVEDALQGFQADDWGRLAEMEAIFTRGLQECARLRERMDTQFLSVPRIGQGPIAYTDA